MSLSVAPTTAIVDPGASTDFDATLNQVPEGQSNDVIWTLSGGGTVFTLSDHSVRYFAPDTAPAPPTVKLIAAAAADPTVTAQVSILVSAIRVTVAPDQASVALTASEQFAATVTGDSTSAGVTWTLTGSLCSVDCGSLSSNATDSGELTTYTAPDRVIGLEPPYNLVILRATSVADPYVSGYATVYVTEF